MWAFEVRGRGFLWHQVRCLISVLLQVGQGHETPEIVDWLLDKSQVSNAVGKPHYTLAPAHPLLFYHCEFPGLAFTRSETASFGLRRVLEARWCKTAVSLAMIQTHLDFLDASSTSQAARPAQRHDFAEKYNPKRGHTLFRDRQRELSYDSRIQSIRSGNKSTSKRRRFERNEALWDDQAERTTRDE